MTLELTPLLPGSRELPCFPQRELIMSSELPFEIVLISVLAFASVLVFTRFHDSFERSEIGAENNEPSTNMSEPNRRNQSATPSTGLGV